MGRAFSLGVTLAAPAVVMSAILGWTLPVTVLAICIPMILYTTLRRRAGRGLDRRQADVHRRRRHAARRSAILLLGIPRDVSFGQALHLAGATGRLQAIDFRVRSARNLHVLVRA